MAQMGEIQHRGDPSDVKGVMNYVYQLEEQIRYVLQNLGSDNLTPGSVDLAQLGPNVTKQFTIIVQDTDALTQGAVKTNRNLITLGDSVNGLYTRMGNAEGDITSLSATATGLTARIANAEGDITSLNATAAGLTARIASAEGDITILTATAGSLGAQIANAEGDITTLSATAASLGARITSAEGNITTLTATANGLEARVSSEEGITSALGLSLAGVDITGSKYVKIRSGGSFTLESDNLDINSTSGLIEASYNGDPHFRVAAGRTQILALDLYSTYDSGYTDVTDTITRLANYGWIRNASVSGNTLTLTKWDGTAINFNKASSALDSLALEAVTGNTSSFRANAYDDSQNVLDYTDGEIYLDDAPGSYSRSTWACVRPTGGIAIAYVPLSGFWDAAQAAAPLPTLTPSVASDGTITIKNGSTTVYAISLNAVTTSDIAPTANGARKYINIAVQFVDANSTYTTNGRMYIDSLTTLTPA